MKRRHSNRECGKERKKMSKENKAMAIPRTTTTRKDRRKRKKKQRNGNKKRQVKK